MRKKEAGFTAAEIVVVVLMLAVLAGFATLVHARSAGEKTLIICQNNLKEIGSLLVVMQAGEGIKAYNGASFLLQVVPQVTDDNLKIFLCPGEPAVADRPAPDTAEFVAMYRMEMDLTKGKIDDRMCSYAGPNWSDFPADPTSGETRLWACDRCRKGTAHHKKGLYVLYANSCKVEMIARADLAGHDPNSEETIVGPNSPDKRLQKMTYYPIQGCPAGFGVIAAEMPEALRVHLRLPAGEGLLVDGVEKGSAAAKLGLERFDVIRTVNGTAVGSAAALEEAVGKIAAGGAMELVIVRLGEPKTLTGNR